MTSRDRSGGAQADYWVFPCEARAHKWRVARLRRAVIMDPIVAKHGHHERLPKPGGILR
jgi:hypothetical protein